MDDARHLIGTEDADQYATTAERVYRELLRKILSGEFVPGRRLPRRKLAELTRASQIPVLEATKRLEQEGLLEYKPRWGCVVAVPTAARLRGLLSLREAIECQIARILAVEAGGPQKEELVRMAEELDRLRRASESEERFSELHHRFHLALAELSGRDSLAETLRRANLFWLLWQGVRAGRSREELPEDWHRRLIRGIESGDPDVAERVMRDHIQTSFRPLMAELGEISAP